jgi:crotonobetainyl-CoA:carnitine CoA-transferase CaiB-like acyl-CoA transferase
VVRRLIRVLDTEAALARPEFSGYETRLAHRDAVNALVGERIRTETVDRWIEHLNAADVPCGRVADLRAVFDDPQVRA